MSHSKISQPLLSGITDCQLIRSIIVLMAYIRFSYETDPFAFMVNLRGAIDETFEEISQTRTSQMLPLSAFIEDYLFLVAFKRDIENILFWELEKKAINQV